MQKSHGKVKTNARVRGKASKLHTCIPSIFPWTKSATPRNPPDRGKTSTASRCLAPVKSQEQDLDRHASLPSRSSVDRQQDGADGCAVSDTGPVKTAADQVETDPGVESQGRSEAQLALQRSADFPWLGKETNKKRTGEWNGKDLPAMCDKMFPPKPCHPARFVLGARDDVLSGPMTYWQPYWQRPHWRGHGRMTSSCTLLSTVTASAQLWSKTRVLRFLGLDVLVPWWEQGCLLLLPESNYDACCLSLSPRRRKGGVRTGRRRWTADVSLKARRHQRWCDDNDQPQARWCFTNNNLSRLHLFCLLVNCNDPRSYNHVQGDDMRDSNPTVSCCLACVAIPCQVQQPGTAPPSGSKRSFFPLLFLPLLIEEQRWNLEQQISEV